MSEDRIELMDLFRRDMTGIEPTRAWPEDQDPHPAFKNHPTVFKFEQSTYLFKVWLAGRDALAAQRDEGLAREAELRSALQGMLEYFPEGYSDGEHFSIATAKVALAFRGCPDGEKAISKRIGSTRTFVSSRETLNK